MEIHNKNQPTTGETYNGLDNQFQQGSFSRQEENEPEKDMGDKEHPGDAYTKQRSEGGIYEEDEEPGEKE